MFSNVDVYSVDKIMELNAKLQSIDNQPQIIALQEVKPKYYRYERCIAEYNLQGYEIVNHNLCDTSGRGMIIYVKTGVKYNIVNLRSTFCEYCCLEFFCADSNFVLVSVYRSPNSDETNDNQLLNLMQEINNLRVKYKIMVGDFNLPDINWSNYTTNAGINGFECKFIERVQDFFMEQFVHEVTRIRGDSMGNTLDLLFCNEDSIIEEVKKSIREE